MRDAAIDYFREPGRGDHRDAPDAAPTLDGVTADGLGPRPGATRRPAKPATSAAVAAQRLGGRKPAQTVGAAQRSAWLGRRLSGVRPLKAVAVAAFAASMVGILANAMMFQRGRHPGPVSGLGQADAAPAPAAVPAAPPAPAERTGAIVPLAPVPAAQPAAPAKPAAAAAPTAKPRRAAVATPDGTDHGAAHHARPGPAPSPPKAADHAADKPEAAAKPPAHVAHAKAEPKADAAEHAAVPEPQPRPKRHAAADAAKAQPRPD